MFELILLGVEVLDERREGAIRRRAFFPGALRLRRARRRRRRLRVRAHRRRRRGTLGRRRAHRDGGPATGWNRAACAAASRRCTSDRSCATSRSFSRSAPDAPLELLHARVKRVAFAAETIHRLHSLRVRLRGDDILAARRRRGELREGWRGREHGIGRGVAPDAASRAAASIASRAALDAAVAAAAAASCAATIARWAASACDWFCASRASSSARLAAASASAFATRACSARRSAATRASESGLAAAAAGDGSSGETGDRAVRRTPARAPG